ncbi:MAG: class I SAM-dependent methyltransferase, partial [Gammaproteobacteria bacterium]|nr:class I SAM-dependent methyltransferase [Gammaproteobacteria bacterium]
THLPYSKESMDMIILLHVLENSTTPKELIQKSSAVLSQGGSMIIFVFSRLLSREKVKQHLKEAELEVIQFGSLAGPLYAFSENKMLSLIDKTLSIALPFLSQAFFIIAKKTLSQPTLFQHDTLSHKSLLCRYPVNAQLKQKGLQYDHDCQYIYRWRLPRKPRARRMGNHTPVRQQAKNTLRRRTFNHK